MSEEGHRLIIHQTGPFLIPMKNDELLKNNQNTNKEQIQINPPLQCFALLATSK